MSLEDTIKENIQFLEKEFENSQNECNPVLQKNIQSDHLGKNKFLNKLDGSLIVIILKCINPIINK